MARSLPGSSSCCRSRRSPRASAAPGERSACSATVSVAACIVATRSLVGIALLVVQIGLLLGGRRAPLVAGRRRRGGRGRRAGAAPDRDRVRRRSFARGSRRLPRSGSARRARASGARLGSGLGGVDPRRAPARGSRTQPAGRGDLVPPLPAARPRLPTRHRRRAARGRGGGRVPRRAARANGRRPTTLRSSTRRRRRSCPGFSGSASPAFSRLPATMVATAIAGGAALAATATRRPALSDRSRRAALAVVLLYTACALGVLAPVRRAQRLYDEARSAPEPFALLDRATAHDKSFPLYAGAARLGDRSGAVRTRPPPSRCARPTHARQAKRCAPPSARRAWRRSGSPPGCSAPTPARRGRARR